MPMPVFVFVFPSSDDLSDAAGIGIVNDGFGFWAFSFDIIFPDPDLAPFVKIRNVLFATDRYIFGTFQGDGLGEAAIKDCPGVA